MWQRPNLVIWNFRIFIGIAVSLLYLLSPFDLLPEAVFGLIGFVDDLGLIFACMCGLAQAYMAVLQNRNNNMNDRNLAAAPQVH